MRRHFNNRPIPNPVLLIIFVAVSLALYILTGEYFIRIHNGEFVEGCKRFRISGWNQWEVLEAAAGAPNLIGSSYPPGKTGPKMIRDMMEEGKAKGFNVMRIWAHSVSKQYALQISPGVYNEAMFRGLDYTLDLARKLGLRMILSLTDNWSEAGGVNEYVEWSRSASRHGDFFKDRAARKYYQTHVRTVINRVNTINGRAYRDDPTIMAWNLINEPRCVGCPEHLQNWIDEMASYVKRIDPNHLLTVGMDGFYSTSGKTWSNPQGGGRWSEKEGQDFIRNHRSKSIDFLTFHSWIDNWGDPTEAFQRLWIREHVADASVMKRPVLLEEFGNQVQQGGPTMEHRNKFFGVVYDEARRQMEKGPLQGAMFWQWFDDGQSAVKDGGDAQRFAIFKSDVAFQSILLFTSFIKESNQPSLPNCDDPGRFFTPDANTTSCESTWVNGKPGTGFEGPFCDFDINECVRATAGCAENAGCVNLEGSYKCECFYGHSGDGLQGCERNRDFDSLASMYSTQGRGFVACDEGQDVLYPVGAPGFIDDPTGSIDKNQYSKGQYGSRSMVSLLDCETACQMSVDCDSFAYNSNLKQCFLKKCPSKKMCRRKEVVCLTLRTKEEYSCGYWQTYFHRGRMKDRNCGPSKFQF
ncbi:hypothetical protein BSKO_07839 [Bryopsis sp. KO-2023]|nr:hypothetical protein BSKO_07839 [Bryopsis sp. KO-2023]